MKKMLDSLLATYANSAIFGINIALLHIKTIFGRNWFFGRIVRKAMSANYARLTLVFAPVLLGGCFGGGDINIVKNAVWEAMPDTTIGKALDSRFSCTTPKWRQFEDERGRSIVEYTCEHKGVREYISRHSKEAFAARKQAVDNQLAALAPEIEKQKERAKRMHQTRAEMLSQHEVQASKDAEQIKASQNEVDRLISIDRAEVFAHNRRQELKNWDESIAQIEKRISDLENEYPIKIKEEQEKIIKSEEESSTLLSNFKSLNETTQWSIVNGAPVHVGSFLELIAANGTIILQMSIGSVISDTQDHVTTELRQRTFYMAMVDHIWQEYQQKRMTN